MFQLGSDSPSPTPEPHTRQSHLGLRCSSHGNLRAHLDAGMEQIQILQPLFLSARVAQGHDDLSTDTETSIGIEAVSLQSRGVYRERSTIPSEMSVIQLPRPRIMSWPGTSWNLPITRRRTHIDPRDILPRPRSMDDLWEYNLPPEQQWELQKLREQRTHVMEHYVHTWLRQLVRDNGMEAVFGEDWETRDSSLSPGLILWGTSPSRSPSPGTAGPSGTYSRPQTAPTAMVAQSDSMPQTAPSAISPQASSMPQMDTTIQHARTQSDSTTLHQHSRTHTASTATLQVTQSPLIASSTQPSKRKDQMSMSVAEEDVVMPSAQPGFEGLPSR